VVNLVDQDGQRRADVQRELNYHNRAHVADALTALAFLLAESSQLSTAEKWLAMIAMAGHDLGHQGKTNQQLQACQEEITADWLSRDALNLLLPQEKAELVRWIIGTDPERVAANHRAFLDDPESHSKLLQVLINEADVAASLVPQLAAKLTQQLLIERGVVSPTIEQITGLYEGFRSHCLISSPAALRQLGEFMQSPLVWLPSYTKSYAAVADSLSLAREDALLFLQKQGVVMGSSVTDIEIALGELLQNIVRHGFAGGDVDQTFTIELTQVGHLLYLSVKDSAKPLHDIGFLDNEFQPSEHGGMGLGIIKKLVNKYSINAVIDGNLHLLEYDLNPH
jgi:serine/threonine-protein kinase RsbW